MGFLDRILAPLRGPRTASPGTGEAVSAPGTAAEIRAETWTRPDGTRVHLLVTAARGIAVVHALVLRGGRFLFAAEVFGEGGIDACGDALLDAASPRPADRRDMIRLRLLPPDHDRLVADVADLLDLLANHPIIRSEHRAPEIRDSVPLPDRHVSGLVDVIEGTDVRGLQSMAWDARPPLPAPARETDRTVTVLDPCTFPPGSRGAANRAILAEVVLPWFEAVRADVLPPDVPALVPALWTPQAYAYYGIGGEAGRRRGQAAALHPGLAPVIASTPDLVALIDEGRPFEAAFAARLASLYDHPEPLRPARMRRLRGLAGTPPATGPGGLREILDVAAGLPVELLPLDDAGWGRLVPHVGAAVLGVSRRHGLPLADLVRGLGPGFGIADLTGPRAGGEATTHDDLASAAIGVDDMTAHCADRLVAPILARIPGAPGVPDAGRIAARLLLEGRTFRRAAALQAEWHQAFLVGGSGPRALLEWPPLFRPYRHDDGVVVRCLTSTTQLVAEGLDGLDADGVKGLSHCVSGYDRSCAAGRIHVASVRVEGESVARVSTVELHVLDLGLRHVVVRQHRGAHNAYPASRAEAAVSALLRDIGAGLHPIDPEAARLRELAEETAAPFDPEAAFASWRPLMTRRAARAGIPGLLAAAGA